LGKSRGTEFFDPLFAIYTNPIACPRCKLAPQVGIFERRPVVFR
jgi:hypothetical protein